MSDNIKHECGIAMLRLRKPLNYYLQKYGTSFYGLNKMYLLMEKQHNRGQDGAGIVNIKYNTAPGNNYIDIKKNLGQNSISQIFKDIFSQFDNLDSTLINDVDYLKDNFSFTGEIFLGHLRYGTHGNNDMKAVHPFHRVSNWKTKNLVLAGNFNLTNVNELFETLISIGQSPVDKKDTITILEKIGHFLDQENQDIFDLYKNKIESNIEISQKISEEMDISKILINSSKKWDGGYAMGGIFGHGDAFVLRDPNGIRPAYWYENDEITVIASERPVIQTVFDLSFDEINEIPRGNAIILKKSSKSELIEILPSQKNLACSFERIYFSRGSDKEIYEERKSLGKALTPKVLKSIAYDLDNSVFSFVPNTAESAFYGLIKGIDYYLNEKKKSKIKALPKLDEAKILEILNENYRIEKITVKDAKLRTFITQENDREDLVAHVYDITYGTVNPLTDNLIVLDDSIVRGTTLKNSIIKILGRLNPKKIIIVSSAPQIRYPDCYGIDMSRLSDFIAFQAMIELVKEDNKHKMIESVYLKCKEQQHYPSHTINNYVKELYDLFDYQIISQKISQMLKPTNLQCELEIIYLEIEDLHKSCPNHLGDWYFSGNYPTPGGYKILNQSFINYYEGNNKRAYE